MRHHYSTTAHGDLHYGLHIYPQGDGAGEIIGGRSELGKRLTTWLGPDGGGHRERTVVCGEERLQAEITVEERGMAKMEAETRIDGVIL